MKTTLLIITALLFSACSASDGTPIDEQYNEQSSVSVSSETTISESSLSPSSEANSISSSLSSSSVSSVEVSAVTSRARIEKVGVSGSEGRYNFSVTINSADTGCNSFADWWEVLDADTNLVYRRILFHSHVSEQPFTRSGGSVAISKSDIVYVRAHMNDGGYGVNQFVGSVAEGFKEVDTNKIIDKNIEFLEPQPDGCAF